MIAIVKNYPLTEGTTLLLENTVTKECFAAEESGNSRLYYTYEIDLPSGEYSYTVKTDKVLATGIIEVGVLDKPSKYIAYK